MAFDSIFSSVVFVFVHVFALLSCWLVWGRGLLVLRVWFVGALFRFAELLCVLCVLLGFVGGFVC